MSVAAWMKIPEKRNAQEGRNFALSPLTAVHLSTSAVLPTVHVVVLYYSSSAVVVLYYYNVYYCTVLY